ncbi:MAG: cupin domain-containing protein [Ottowia sp.]
MKLNTDYSQRVVINSLDLPWVQSPTAGVQRRLLERDGEEDAKATSIVRYAPGSSFPKHGHPLGEEFFVLRGDFQDEHAIYPAGAYVKNPPGSAHSPGTVGGCDLLVKLRHLPASDTRRVVALPQDRSWHPGLVRGLHVCPLDSVGNSHTALVRWAPGTHFDRHRHFGGEEIFVVEGVFEDEHQAYPAGTWLRNPHLSVHQPFSTQGCLILVKTGHLPH